MPEERKGREATNPAEDDNGRRAGIATRSEQENRLQAQEIRMYFGGVRAVDGVDFVLHRGEILGLIGPNGAGKTTLVNVLSGFLRPTGGRVFLAGREVTGWAPSELARIGLGRTFQNLRLFSELSVLENVEAGAVGVGLDRRAARKLAWELLERMNLVHKASSPADSLPQGDKRRVGIMRALATRPKFLLLDEPAAGLSEAEGNDLIRTVAAVRDDLAMGVVVIEHEVRVIMRLCDRIHVLDHGRTISIGSPAEVRADPAVLTAYLGTRGG